MARRSTTRLLERGAPPTLTNAQTKVFTLSSVLSSSEARAPRQWIVTFLPEDLYAHIEDSVPIACVNFVPTRDVDGGRGIGLILRESPFGRVWCHLGGRILRGETVRSALQRHALDTLGVQLELPIDPQPQYLYQWFPPSIMPSDQGEYGIDPRKHAIGLSFLVTLDRDAVPRNEALAFEYFAPDALPDTLWPGCRTLLGKLFC